MRRRPVWSWFPAFSAVECLPKRSSAARTLHSAVAAQNASPPNCRGRCPSASALTTSREQVTRTQLPARPHRQPGGEEPAISQGWAVWCPSVPTIPSGMRPPCSRGSRSSGRAPQAGGSPPPPPPPARRRRRSRPSPCPLPSVPLQRRADRGVAGGRGLPALPVLAAAGHPRRRRPGAFSLSPPHPSYLPPCQAHAPCRTAHQRCPPRALQDRRPLTFGALSRPLMRPPLPPPPPPLAPPAGGWRALLSDANLPSSPPPLAPASEDSDSDADLDDLPGLLSASPSSQRPSLDDLLCPWAVDGLPTRVR